MGTYIFFGFKFDSGFNYCCSKTHRLRFLQYGYFLHANDKITNFRCFYQNKSKHLYIIIYPWTWSLYRYQRISKRQLVYIYATHFYTQLNSDVHYKCTYLITLSGNSDSIIRLTIIIWIHELYTYTIFFFLFIIIGFCTCERHDNISRRYFWNYHFTNLISANYLICIYIYYLYCNGFFH